jgi:hypothetical protein
MRVNKSLTLNPIKLPLTFLVVSTLPLIVISSITEDSLFFNHLVMNLLLVIVSLFLSYIIPSAFNPWLIILRFLLRVRLNFKEPIYMVFILLGLVFIFEAVAIVLYDKANLISAMIYGNAMDQRIFSKDLPFYLGFLVNNYHPLLLLLMGVVYKLLIDGPKKYKIMLTVALLFLIVIYLGSLKKSSFFIIGYFFVLISWFVNRKIFNFSNFIRLAITLPIFYVVLLTYYPDGDLILRIFSRVFLESVGTSSTFMELYQRHHGLGLNYIPSEGARLFGFAGGNLENQLFKDLFPGRGERYGNFSTLSYTYAVVVFGNIGSLVFIIAIFLTNIQILRYLYSVYVKTKTYANFLNFHIFSLMFLTCFVTGAFKTLTIFLLFPISTYIYIIGFVSVRGLHVLKKVR